MQTRRIATLEGPGRRLGCNNFGWRTTPPGSGFASPLPLSRTTSPQSEGGWRSLAGGELSGAAWSAAAGLSLRRRNRRLQPDPVFGQELDAGRLKDAAEIVERAKPKLLATFKAGNGIAGDIRNARQIAYAPAKRCAMKTSDRSSPNTFCCGRGMPIRLKESRSFSLVWSEKARLHRLPPPSAPEFKTGHYP
jgi:hypothetical protein